MQTSEVTMGSWCYLSVDTLTPSLVVPEVQKDASIPIKGNEHAFRIVEYVKICKIQVVNTRE